MDSLNFANDDLNTTNIFVADQGITVLICGYNSAERLIPTLQALASLTPPTDFLVEVLVVDNASTDETTVVAQRTMAESNSFFTHRVLYEARPGKSNALQLGLAQARYRYVCIVDDDNWLEPSYLNLAWQIMEADSAIAALGGVGLPAFKGNAPEWFSRFAIDFAAAPQAPESGDITYTNRYVYGAGMVLRKQAWEEVNRQGFISLLTTIRGNKPSGEDNEMCYALIFAGYKIWYDKRLRFQHFISADRLTWSYLRKTYRVNATSEIELRPWTHFLESNSDLTEVPTLAWLRNGIYMIRYLLHFLLRTLRQGELGKEGSSNYIRVFYYWHAFKECMRRELRQDRGFYKAQEFIARLRYRHPLI